MQYGVAGALWLFDCWQQNVKDMCVCIHVYIQPISFEVLSYLSLQSQSPWSLCNGTWWKRPRELDDRLRFENEKMTLQMQ